MIRRIVAVAGAACLVCGVATPAAAQPADDPIIENPSDAELALARQIIDLGFPISTREAVFFATLDQMQQQMRDASLKAYELDDEGAIAVLDEWAAEYNADTKDILRSHIPLLMEAMAKSYAVMFSQKELTDILAFVSTPSGQRFFELSSAIMAEPHFATANQAYMDESQRGVPDALKDLAERLRQHYEIRAAEETPTTS